MADPYVSRAEMKSYFEVEDDTEYDDAEIDSTLAAITTGINDVCGRSFWRDEVASTRYFVPDGPSMLRFDDFYTLTDFAVTVDGGAWTAASNFRLMPANGIVNGEPWPYHWLETRIGNRLSLGYDVAMTARWGWAAVPGPVKQACKIVTADTLGLREAKFGVAGFGQYGAVRVRGNAIAMGMLDQYIRQPVKVG